VVVVLLHVAEESVVDREVATGLLKVDCRSAMSAGDICESSSIVMSQLSIAPCYCSPHACRVLARNGARGRLRGCAICIR